MDFLLRSIDDRSLGGILLCQHVHRVVIVEVVTLIAAVSCGRVTAYP